MFNHFRFLLIDLLLNLKFCMELCLEIHKINWKVKFQREMKLKIAVQIPLDLHHLTLRSICEMMRS